MVGVGQLGCVEAVLNWCDGDLASEAPPLNAPPPAANNSAGADGEVTGRHIKRERRRRRAERASALAASTLWRLVITAAGDGTPPLAASRTAESHNVRKLG